MPVTFSNSGTLDLFYNGNLPPVSGTVVFFDEETRKVIYSANHPISGSQSIVSYNISDMHTSKDTYFVGVSASGYKGDCRHCSGLSPTVEVLKEDYLEPFYPVSGTQIFYENFETGSTSNLTLATYGTGITSSGIQASSLLEGNYNVTLNASANASLYLTATSPAASGLLKGRTIFLMNLGFDSGTNDQVVGFSFLRQGSSLNSNGYKVFLRSDASDPTKFNICFSYGALGNLTTGVVNGSGTEYFYSFIDFYSLDVRRFYRKNWVIIEWEVSSVPDNHIKIACYHKIHEVGDTVESVRTNAKLVRQLVFCGENGGTGLYTSTSLPVQWFLNSDNGSTTRIDCIYLESIDNVVDEGLFNSKFSLLDFSGGLYSSSSRRAQVNNIQLNLGVRARLGSIYETYSWNPLISTKKSLYGIARYGHSGPIFQRFVAGSHRAFMSYYFTSPLASGIKSGVFRGAVRVGNIDNTFGFSFLAQGDNVTSDAYTVLFYRSALDDYRLQLRKGTILANVSADTVYFGGSTLVTSSTLTSIVDRDMLWVEVRWKAGASSTAIQVKYAKLITGYGDLNIDTSPGNVDYKLISAIDTTDSSSPYLTTSVSPVVSTVVEDDTPGIMVRWLQIELRRAKFGN